MADLHHWLFELPHNIGREEGNNFVIALDRQLNEGLQILLKYRLI
jgi:hypothetical protein